MKLAITGGTGFVGPHLIDAALGAGHEIRALTRRDQQPRDGVEWVPGNLEDREALRKLVTDADAVIHVAGAISAANAAGFEQDNVDGTLAMLAAATAGGVHRFVHVSSLAAREPKLSLYGASKARAEELVERSGLDWAMVRPPAVYGPGDKETLELFRMAKLGLIVVPPRGRLSLLHVDDLASLLLALAEPDAPSALVIEADDGTPGGWTHREFALALGTAVGRKPTIVPAPGTLIRIAAHADQLVRGPRAKLTVDRAAYFSHHDWVIDPTRAPPPGLWHPRVQTEQGLAQTAAWYRAQGWL
jgi:nucleoside-diphosphate-sugar epimerase